MLITGTVMDGDKHRITAMGVPFINTYDIVDDDGKRHHCYVPEQFVGQPHAPVYVKVGNILTDLAAEPAAAEA